MERDSDPAGREGGHGISPRALAGLDAGASGAMAAVIGLYREFPAWAVWPPSRGRSWTAVRPASGRVPGPDLPMVWVHAAASANELAERMRGVDAQLTPP
ncbi:MAG TPA: hypothetical protein VI365_36380 [Trebonia sp.]